jgi:uncharacterized protein YjiS (DUF1127 family)
MTPTIDFAEIVSDRQRSAANSSTHSLTELWRKFVRRRQEHRALVNLSRLPPHLIRDMGFDPERIYDALDGTWDELGDPRFPKV